MKNITFLLVFALLCVFVLSACGVEGDVSAPAESASDVSTPAESNDEESIPAESNDEESIPNESAIEESTSEVSTIEESLPEESIPEESTPEESQAPAYTLIGVWEIEVDGEKGTYTFFENGILWIESETNSFGMLYEVDENQDLYLGGEYFPYELDGDKFVLGFVENSMEYTFTRKSDNNYTLDTSVVGTWVSDDELYYTFDAQGVITMRQGDQTASSIYLADGEYMYITDINGDVGRGEYIVEGNTLKLIAVSSGIELTKVE